METAGQDGDEGVVIQRTGTVYQMGEYPYLHDADGDGAAASSLKECEQRCLDHRDCKFGTFVTETADTPEGYNYQKKSTQGQCWLSTSTHASPTPCGVPCTGSHNYKKSSTIWKPCTGRNHALALWHTI